MVGIFVASFVWLSGIFGIFFPGVFLLFGEEIQFVGFGARVWDFVLPCMQLCSAVKILMFETRISKRVDCKISF